MQEFREEAQEHLVSLEAELLAMERGGIAPEQFNRIFRSAHTIKGGAGFLGLTGVGAIAHNMETVLALLRDGKMDFGRGISAVLLGAVDVLRRLLASAPDEGGLDVRPTVAQLEDLLDVPTAASIHEEAEEWHSIGPPAMRLKTTSLRLRQIPSSQGFQYLLTYTKAELYQRQSRGRSPIALWRELDKLGTLVDDFLPESGFEAGDPDDSPSILILFSTGLEPSHMPMATGLSSEDILPLDLKEILAEIHAGETMSAWDFEVPPPPSRPKPKPKPRLQPLDQVRAPAPAQTPQPARTPLPAVEAATQGGNETVRVRVDVLDRLMRLAGELVLVRNRQLCRIDGTSLPDREIAQRLDQVTAGIQDAVLSARMQPLGNVLSKFERIVHDLGRQLDKDIALRIEGGETKLDRTLLEALSDPLTHIVRNCCDHGIEMPADRIRSGKSSTGTITVTAWHEAGRVHVRIADDGKGIDAAVVRAKASQKGLRSEEELSRLSEREIRQMVFLPGFSTAAKVSDLSGRGVGMDVVRSSIERLGGTVMLDSLPGAGTTLDLLLPLTLAIVPALVVEAGGLRFAIPQAGVEELVRLYDEDLAKLENVGGEDLFRRRRHLLPLVSLRQVLASPVPMGPEDRARCGGEDRKCRSARLEAFRSGAEVGISETFAVLKAGRGRFGLVLDRILGTEEIVVEPLHPGLGYPAIYAGATLLGDGEIALILDVQGVCRHAGLLAADADQAVGEPGGEARGMLLFRSGPEGQIGIPLSALRRVVRMRSDEIERSGDREYVQLEEHSVRVERLDRILAVSPGSREGDFFLLLPSGEDRTWGIAASELVDSGMYSFESEACAEEGPLVRGTALLRGHRTLLLDETRLAQALAR